MAEFTLPEHAPLATLDMNLSAFVEREETQKRERAEKLDEFLGNLYAENTEHAYKGDWRHWMAWCAAQRRKPMPATPQDVLDYLLDHAETLKPSTLERRLITIGKAHKSFDHESPTRDERVKKAFKGLIRTYGRRTRRAAPLVATDMRAFIDMLDEQGDEDLLAKRDRALLLIGWFGAFRQSELVALRVDEITEHSDEEFSLLIPRSKTDQTGEGHQKWLTSQREPRYCPLQAIQDWKVASGVTDGPLLRAVGRWGHVSKGSMRPQAITDAIRRVARLAGYETEIYSGHSLRRGFCVQAALNGATLDEIMAQTHHRDISTVMRYIEEANARRRNAVRKIEL
jgi:site-specific recombinase XerD